METGGKPKKGTYDVDTEVGRRRIRNKIKSLESHADKGYVLTKPEKETLSNFKKILEDWETSNEEAKAALLKASAEAGKLKLDTGSVEQQNPPKTEEPGEVGATGQSPTQEPSETEPPQGAAATGVQPDPVVDRPQPRRSRTPTPTPPPSSSSDSESDDDDDMPGKPTGQEINSIPLFTGNETEPDIWLAFVERAAATFDWREDSLAGAAALRLTEKAALWLESQRKLNKLPFENWDAFKAAFLERFRPLDTALRAVSSVIDLK